jgi:hypothetical protein
LYTYSKDFALYLISPTLENSDEEDDKMYAYVYNHDEVPPMGESEWQESCDHVWGARMITLEAGSTGVGRRV